MAKDRTLYLKRDGQSRKKRLAAAPDPLSAKIDDRTEEDLLGFAAEYAKELRFFDLTNTAKGDWTPFFEEAVKVQEGGLTPHMALFRAFLLLFRRNLDYLNGLTGRHLDFYYEDILRMERKGPVPDKVHLVFELKKNSPDQMVKAGTAFKAGKDAKKKEILYSLTDDVTITPAAIAEMRSVFVDPLGGGLHIAPVANSGDGLGGPLDKNSPQWQAFGNAALPAAEPGFGLASPLLLLKEGTRKISVSLTLGGISNDEEFQKSRNAFDLYLTGEKGWIGPEPVSLTSSGQGVFSFDITLQPDEGAIVPFNQDKHGGGFETDLPLMQLLMRKEEAGRYPFFRDAMVQAMEMQVEVSGLTSLLLQNDLGSIDGSKPFMPFGPQPKAGARLHIGCDEAFSKKLDTFSLRLQWQAPADLSKVYTNYTTKVTNSSFTAELSSPDGKSWNAPLFDSHDASAPVEFPSGQNSLSFPGKEFSGSRELKLLRQSNRWAAGELGRLSKTGKTFSPAIEKLADILRKQASSPQPEQNALVLRLQRDFLHQEYRQVYVENVISLAKGTGGSLPGEPYTPVMEAISLSYTASTGRVDPGATDEDSYLNTGMELFHIGAFGQKREHRFLKAQLPFVADKRVFLLPQYRSEGEFYIGLKGLRPGQNLPMLFQVAEGSANPDKDKAEVRWSILSDNEWQLLSSQEILLDTTNGLLTSGIVSLSIPDDGTDQNTFLPSGCYWLRADLLKDTDAVSRLIDVQPNAATAAFQDNGNDPLRLETPLAAKMIKKPAADIPALKAVGQPYASFGGSMAEDDRSFYARVSERLRHKDRAVSLWDYERLVLEHFPNLYKVKCLNHTSPSSGSAPGHVTIVVIPDIRNRNAVDPLRPKADKNSLEGISAFLSVRTSGFAELHLRNPSYEEVLVKLRVRFKKGKDFGQYRAVLNDDITRFLSPWAYDEGEDMGFGGVFRKSALINFVEERPYLDYLEDFSMHRLTGGAEGPDSDLIEASGPGAILVSARQHGIEKVEGDG